MDKCAKIIVTGLVQGVNFRYDCKKIADNLNLKGQVRNLENGDKVEIIAEGDVKDIDKLISWCKEGNIYSKVENVEFEWQNPVGKYDQFEVIYE